MIQVVVASRTEIVAFAAEHVPGGRLTRTMLRHEFQQGPRRGDLLRRGPPAAPRGTAAGPAPPPGTASPASRCRSPGRRLGAPDSRGRWPGSSPAPRPGPRRRRPGTGCSRIRPTRHSISRMLAWRNSTFPSPAAAASARAAAIWVADVSMPRNRLAGHASACGSRLRPPRSPVPGRGSSRWRRAASRTSPPAVPGRRRARPGRHCPDRAGFVGVRRRCGCRGAHVRSAPRASQRLYPKSPTGLRRPKRNRCSPARAGFVT